MKRVAVVGGGIFGVTAAVHAARAGHRVELFEKQEDLLMAASSINQYRLHRGYHYPRSPETATSAQEAESHFRDEYGSAVIDSGRHLYAIANEGSLVSGEEFLAFCEEQSLDFKIVKDPQIVNPEKASVLIEGVEARFDPFILRDLAWGKLRAASVTVHLNTEVTTILEAFDVVIVATYAHTAELAGLFGEETQYQFEVCEKPVVELPSWFGDTALVVMDGPFMCVDPFGTTGNYVLGNVVHAIHATNTGVTPHIPPKLATYVNKGIITNPVHTKFNEFIKSGSPFIPALQEARHVGSLYTVRTVLPNLESTDARPTLVSQLSERCIRIFSGKIGNCVRAAQQATALIG